MLRRIPVIALLGALLAFSAACTNKKVNNPLANVGSKQPDKVLFDRAMDAMKHNRFDVARMTLQTLINTYPDSEFVARAKLAVGDSWYAEGGSAALAQAEIEYKDFETFFPNMPEASEAQLKIANIHYQQMEKPDRDYTHAMRAEEEYRSLILQYPDSKLVPEAKQRLLEVQEVLGEREYEIGRFYYLRQSYPAAIARLNSLVDRYPLYSHADDALYLMGQALEGEIAIIRSKPMNETAKARAIDEFTKEASDAYAKIITRYPLMDRVEDAQRRLEALHRPIPKPTQAAIAQNKAEQDSRHSTGMISSVLGGFKKHPDVAAATHVGEPTLVDPHPIAAPEVVNRVTSAMLGKPAGGTGSITPEIKNDGAPPPNQPAPRSDTPQPDASISVAPPPDSSAQPPVAAGASDSNELKPNVPAESNELKVDPAAAASSSSAASSSDNGGQALPPPPQVNEVQSPENAPAANAASSSSSAQTDQQSTSSSKPKKKKGLKKIIPF
jgi:outer membrane protein assembly factor BamD